MQDSVELSELKERLDYDPEQGVFVRKATKSFRPLVGRIAGSYAHKSGYVFIEVDRKKYAAHRLAWLFVHGKWPTEAIDHINRVRSDNRICNLREASNFTNSQNRTKCAGAKSSHRGVSFFDHLGKWSAKVRHRHIGVFKTEAEAAEVAQLVRAMTMPFSEDAALLPVFIGANLPVGFRKQTES